MRAVVWLILLFTVAVVAATVLGHNDGLVTVAWKGWRLELSLNLAVCLLLATGLAGHLLMRGLDALLSLPRRAGEWRALQRERAAHNALNEALTDYFGARYSRAHKAAQRAVAIPEERPRLRMASEHRVLAQLLSAGSLHRLQDRAGRDAVLDGLHLHKGSATVRAAAEGGRLLAAEWALDDQDATRAQSLLDALPPGVARRSHALRLRLRAARLGRKTQDALEITRLLAKHQAFSPTAARGLLRALALEHLDAARDASQLRRQWDLLDTSDRADSVVLAQAVRQAATLGAQEDARRWIEPAWAGLHRLDAAERAGLALALAGVAAGAEPVWLERMEQAVRDWPADPNIAAAAGEVYAARQLWGKARRALESAAAAPALVGTARRRAWRSLALLAREEDDEARAARCDRAAAEIDD